MVAVGWLVGCVGGYIYPGYVPCIVRVGRPHVIVERCGTARIQCRGPRQGGKGQRGEPVESHDLWLASVGGSVGPRSVGTSR